MGLKLYNTMGRSMQDFAPITDGKAGFYGCGPTVYNYAHIGNLRAYVFQDILARTLEFLGYAVSHVMNVTDIGHLTGDADEGEDKMVKTARERGQSVLEIAQFYTDAFFHDTERLNIRKPSVVCKATDHIPSMIALIKKLEERGHTYVSGGNLYFDVSTFPDYGKLALLNLDDLKAGARIDVDENKRNPYDFVLWFTKSKFENQALTWDSPWGNGYPGWHIECSAMSMEYLGEQFDIHTGGIDHIPIHHTNEIAQSEGATGKRWVNYWLHNEFLVMDKGSSLQGGKMSKSSGNFITLQSLVDEGFDPLDYRFFLLGAHYRSQVAFSQDAMKSARNSRAALVRRIAGILKSVPGFSAENAAAVGVIGTLPEGSPAAVYLERFKGHMEQDLATPRALSELQMLVKDGAVPPEEVVLAVQRMDSVLGLSLIEAAEAVINAGQGGAGFAAGAGSVLAGSAGAGASDGEAREIEVFIAERNEAKKSKNYQRADEIRTILKDRGILLEDTPQGTIWKRV
ncbi:MAG: cysteine--tRNA ligase [Spirochaetaceae bacterium]|jgi:cysteinyl-tRNA synthetase|nr:cysteine--tRNA ligase [Spirochaetaceae bacterium]